jgi:hypothetical protein
MFTVTMPPLVLKNGETVGSTILRFESFEDAEVIDIYGPASINAATGIKLQVTDDPNAAVPVWYDYTTDGSTAFPMPGLSKSRSLVGFAFRGMRLAATGAPNADTTFPLTKKYRLY